MTVDFSEMNPQTPGPINSGRSGGIAAARVAFKALTSPDLDVNEGCFRALEVMLPEGTMRQRAAAGRDRAVEHRAADGDRHDPEGAGAGAAGASFRPRTRATWAAARSTASAPTAALPADEHLRRRLGRPAARGWRGSPRVSVCQGDVRNSPVELQEIRYPFLVEKLALRRTAAAPAAIAAGSASSMTYRGAAGPARPTSIASARKDPPWGLHGGKPAPSTRRSCGRPRRPRAQLAQGDRHRARGRRPPGLPHRRRRRLGRPAARAPEAVADDVAQGFVSAEAARRDYGVDAVR